MTQRGSVAGACHLLALHSGRMLGASPRSLESPHMQGGGVGQEDMAEVEVEGTDPRECPHSQYNTGSQHSHAGQG